MYSILRNTDFYTDIWKLGKWMSEIVSLLVLIPSRYVPLSSSLHVIKNPYCVDNMLFQEGVRTPRAPPQSQGLSKIPSFSPFT